jgi:hypothetical protein
VLAITYEVLQYVVLAAAQGGTARWNSGNPFALIWNVALVIAACLVAGCFIQAWWDQYRKER